MVSGNKGVTSAVDLALLGAKLRRYREQFPVSLEELSPAVGIPAEDLAAIEEGRKGPTGDQLLVLADFYKCDYMFFVSGELLAPIDQTEKLFRRHGDSLSREDRWAIQEFFFLCECESYLEQERPRLVKRPFQHQKRGGLYKQHGVQAAQALRDYFKYPANAVPRDVYSDFRSLGLHVFRRRLGNSNISGLYVKHPKIGKCILVNYDEDIYRQRFTAAHEVGHALLDDDDVVLTFHSHWSSSELSEIRANQFASHYLMPPAFLTSIPEPRSWTADKVVHWANQLRVNPRALVYALKGSGLIDATTANGYERLMLKGPKHDPEIPEALPAASRKRRMELLERGLSNYYVGLCFDAYTEGIISAGRLAEMLLVPHSELDEVADLFGRGL